MARPEPWRLAPESYHSAVTLQTRFQDLDTNGHLNNVAFAALFESARVLFTAEVRPRAERPANERTVVASVTIDYLGEGYFPQDVVIHSGVGRIGTSSWVIEQAMFQGDACIAVCDTVVVCRTGGESLPLRPSVRAGLEALVTPRR